MGALKAEWDPAVSCISQVFAGEIEIGTKHRTKVPLLTHLCSLYEKYTVGAPSSSAMPSSAFPAIRHN
jgi:hypothetical protein